MSPEALARAAEVLRSGGLVAFPTETVYGLGADAANTDAIKKIYAAKGRPRNHPLIVHLGSASQVSDWAIDVPVAAARLGQRFWPGPLTLIFKRALHVNDLVTGGQDTIALRVPSHPVAQALLASFGRGIAAPSANRYGRVSATRAEHVRTEFGSAVDCVLDGGACDLGIESTIVDVSGPQPALLRPGSISARELEAVLGMPLGAPGSQSPRAPGTLPKHYAPRTPLMLIEADLLLELAGSMARQNQRVAVLARSARRPVAGDITWIAAPADARGYAHELYSNLRTLDAAGCAAILVEQPPLATEWAAIQDRLMRAAAGSAVPDAT
jgi:L-threonylcarbamoyladenylate synthase